METLCGPHLSARYSLVPAGVGSGPRSLKSWLCHRQEDRKMADRTWAPVFQDMPCYSLFSWSCELCLCRKSSRAHSKSPPNATARRDLAVVRSTYLGKTADDIQ